MQVCSVIIISFNTVTLLRTCLASLRACQLALEVIVVDNDSHDGSPAMVRAEFPEVRLLALDHNLGFAGATNRGLAAVTGTPPFYLLLNPDTVVHPGAIETLVAFLEAHPRVGMVGPRLLNPDGTLQQAAFRFPTLLMTLLDLFPPGEVLPGRLYGSWWHGRYPHATGTTPFAIDHPLGACMLVRREVVATVGALDQRYFMYSEEIEWCWRIKATGWAIWQVPAATVTHVGGAATSQVRPRMFVALWQSRLQFTAQHRSPQSLHAQRSLVRLGMLRLTLLAWLAYAGGRLSYENLRSNLWAYGTVFRL
ncbi:glycosyltransferase family 2 protein [Candidatus Chloroploca asiatica]|uniref:Glycosyl transferase n=1 Tax=Candidatus Chloroploca asiatica TaxID=1506545 RepID=A0A2H3KHR8_9CHLR|nr:glycosyltransferase family 2 protein [Candidatus Chloroploca asiatica]PDV97355.1 glycosyl transferase [Candidatus Chloroploca asiatica]